MFGFLFLITGVISTYLILSGFKRNIFNSSFEILAASIPLSFVSIAFLASIFTLAMPTGTAAISSLGFLLVGAIFSFKKIRGAGESFWFGSISLKKNVWIFIVVGAICLTTIILIVWGFTVHNDGTWSIGGTKAVDSPYHIGQAIRIATMEQWDFEESNFAGEFIRYSYYINFVSGVLMKFGMSVAWSMHAPVILLTISWAILLVFLLKFLELKPAFLILVIIITLFGSGLGYVASITSDGQYGPLLRGDAVWPMQNIAYPAMIPGFLIWQRSFILGFSLFLASLLLFLKGIKNNNSLSLFIAGISAGLLPFAHMHSFLTISVIGGAALFILMINKDPMFLVVLRSFAYPVLLLGVPQAAILILLPRFPLPEITTLRFGWMSNPQETGGIILTEGASRLEAWLRYMWTNFGPLTLVPIAIGYFWEKIPKEKFIAALALGAVLLWILPNVIKFQIWDFDNNKLFPYAILMSLIALASWLQNIKYGLIVFILLAVFTIPSSLMEIVNILARYKNERIVILDSAQKEAARWIARDTPVDAIFLPSMTLLNRTSIVQDPAIIASGRRATSAYKVLIFTHGIDSFERRQIIEEFFDNPSEAREKIKTIPADYLIADNILRLNYPHLEKELIRAKYPIVFEKEYLRIFDLKWRR